MRNNLPKSGFTLIEILLVISIIGLMASIVYVNVNSARDKAKTTKSVQFSQNIYHAMGDSAVGYWDFNEIIGSVVPYTVRDLSGNGNAGTLTNMDATNLAESKTFSGGNYGKALSFDGSNEYVNIPSSSSLKPTEAIAIEAWIRPDLQGTREFVATKWQGLTMELDTNNRITCGVYVDGLQRMTPPTSALTNNTWNHLVFTYSSTDRTLKTYLNGGQEIKALTLSSLSTYLMAVSDNSLKIGNYGSYYFNGRIDEVRIYSKALTSAEIQQHYAEGLPRHLTENF